MGRIVCLTLLALLHLTSVVIGEEAAAVVPGAAVTPVVTSTSTTESQEPDEKTTGSPTKKPETADLKPPGILLQNDQPAAEEQEPTARSDKDCRYQNDVGWSDCDPMSYLRTKVVRLTSSKAQDHQGMSSCPPEKTLTKTCTWQELPSGTQKLVHENQHLLGRQLKMQYEVYSMQQKLAKDSFMSQMQKLQTQQNCQGALEHSTKLEKEISLERRQTDKVMKKNVHFRRVFAEIKRQLKVYHGQLEMFFDAFAKLKAKTMLSTKQQVQKLKRSKYLLLKVLTETFNDISGIRGKLDGMLNMSNNSFGPSKKFPSNVKYSSSDLGGCNIKLDIAMRYFQTLKHLVEQYIGKTDRLPSFVLYSSDPAKWEQVIRETFLRQKNVKRTVDCEKQLQQCEGELVRQMEKYAQLHNNGTQWLQAVLQSHPGNKSLHLQYMNCRKDLEAEMQAHTKLFHTFDKEGPLGNFSMDNDQEMLHLNMCHKELYLKKRNFERLMLFYKTLFEDYNRLTKAKNGFQGSKYAKPNNSEDYQQEHKNRCKDDKCQVELATAKRNLTMCAKVNYRKKVIIVYLKRKLEELMKRDELVHTSKQKKKEHVDPDKLLDSEAQNKMEKLTYGGGDCGSLYSQIRLMKLVMANMVLSNANLSSEVTVLKSLLGQYQQTTSQDLLSTMHWFANQLSEAMAASTNYQDSGSTVLLTPKRKTSNPGVVGDLESNGTSHGQQEQASTPDLQRALKEMTAGANGNSMSSSSKNRIYGPLSGMLQRLDDGSHYYVGHEDTNRLIYKALSGIQQQISGLKYLATKAQRQGWETLRNNNVYFDYKLARLTNQTSSIKNSISRQLKETLLQKAKKSSVSSSRYEMLEHQKEELELQNRRLVTRISKLKYLLEAYKETGDGLKLSKVSEAFKGKIDNLAAKVKEILDRYVSVKKRNLELRKFTGNYGQQVARITETARREIDRVLGSSNSTESEDGRQTLHKVLSSLKDVESFSNYLSKMSINSSLSYQKSENRIRENHESISFPQSPPGYKDNKEQYDGGKDELFKGKKGKDAAGQQQSLHKYSTSSPTTIMPTTKVYSTTLYHPKTTSSHSKQTLPSAKTSYKHLNNQQPSSNHNEDTTSNYESKTEYKFTLKEYTELPPYEGKPKDTLDLDLPAFDNEDSAMKLLGTELDQLKNNPLE